ncbi:MAG: hypothetical protein AB7F40_06365 [Victivallaceae bacterium]|nr:hypothetical protein [Victivallaceae bacterium]
MSENEKKKRSWKKIVISILVGLAVLIGILIVAFFIFMDWILATGIREIVPKFTGTEVLLESVKLSPVNGNIALRGFTVCNPKGYNGKAALQFDAFTVDVDLGSITGDKIIINEIRIVKPAITWERGLTGSNLGDIQENIEKMTKSGKEEQPASDAAEAKAESEAGKKVIIKRLVIENARLYVGIKGAGQNVPIPLATITLTNIGEDKAATVAEAVNYIYDELIVVIVNTASKSGGEAAAMAADVGGQLIDRAGTVVKDVGGSALHVIEKTGEIAIKTVTDTGDTLVKDIGGGIGNALSEVKIK